MKIRYKVIKIDYKYKNIEEIFDDIANALLYMEDLEGRIILQKINEDDKVIEEWKKNTNYLTYK